MATPVEISVRLKQDNLLYKDLDAELTRFEKSRKLNLELSNNIKNRLNLQLKDIEKTPLRLDVRINQESLKQQIQDSINSIGGSFAGGSGNGSSKTQRKQTKQPKSTIPAELKQAAAFVKKMNEGAIPGLKANAANARKTPEVEVYISELEKVHTLYSTLSEDGKKGIFKTPDDISKWNDLYDMMSNIGAKAETAKKSLNVLSEEDTYSKIKNKFYDYKNRFGEIVENNSPEQYSKLIAFEEKLSKFGENDFPNKNVKELLADYEKLTAEISQSGGNVKTAGQQSIDAISTLQRYSIIMGMYSGSVKLFKQVIQTTRDIEYRMAQLQIVTRASASEILDFGKDAAAAAKEIGTTITDIMRSAETWSRLGYSLSDSLDMSKVTAAFGNVADTSVEQGTASMTSILKAYNFDPSQLEYISDVLVNIGARYAVSAEEIGIAMQAAGAALEAGNNTFEESVALIAAGNAAIQDASKVGNALKTSSLRIRGSTAELEEMGEEIDGVCESSSKLRDEIKALTGGKVDIMLSDGTTYKSMYQIMLDIADVWDSLSDINQATLLEDLAGKRNSSIIKSIITNVNDLKGAYKDSFTSAGITMESNEIALDTIDGKMKQLTTTAQKWSKDFSFEEPVKLGISALISFLELWDGVPSRMLLVGTSITGLNVAIKGLSKVGLFDVFSKQAIENIKNSGTFLKNFGTQIFGIAKAHPALMAIAAAFAAIGGYIAWTTSKGERFQKQLEKFNEEKDKLDEIESKIQANDEKLSEIQSKGKLSLTDKADIENLKKQNAELAIQKDLQERLLKIEKEKLINKTNSGDYKETGKWRWDKFSLKYEDFDTAVYWLEKQNEILNDPNTKEGSLKWQNASKTKGEKEEFILNQLNEDIKTLKNYTDLSGEAQGIITKRINTAYTALGYGENEIAKNAFNLASGIEGFDTVISDLKANKISFNDLIENQEGKYSDFLNFISKITGYEIPENTSSQMKKQFSDDFEAIKTEAAAFGVDLSKTIYGNIDTNNRQSIEWNGDNLLRYKDALKSWDIKREELEGDISTVLGMSDEFDGVEIAFSPILQTNNGAVLLDKDTLYEYINQLIARAGEGWTTEGLLKLDITGIDINGRRIKGMIADVGDTAIQTGKAMHYTGNSGAVSRAQNNIDNFVQFNSVSPMEKMFDSFVETGDAAEEATEKVKSFKDQISTLSDIEGNLGKIPDMLKEFKEGEPFGTAELSEIAETFSGVDGLEESLEKLANPNLSLDELKTTLGDLTSQLILTKIASGELSAENENLIAKMLKAAGVSNSTAAAHELCVIAKEKERLATYDFTTMTADEIIALGNEKNATEATRFAILELIKAKIKQLSTVINTASDVDQLIKLATAAGVATSELGSLNRARHYFDEADRFNKIAESQEDKNGRGYKLAKQQVELYRQLGNDIVKSESESIMDDINERIKTHMNFTPSYTPTSGKDSKSSSTSKDEPDYEDATDAIIRRIAAQAREHEKNVQALDDKLALIDVEKEYEKAVELTELREKERAKQRQALLEEQRNLSAQADYVRNNSGYADTDAWYDNDGEFTVEYYNLINSLGSKTAQDNLKDFAESLQKYKKAWLETAEDIQKIDEEILSDEKQIWEYRKKIADKYSDDADAYISEQEEHGWKNGDSKLSALYRKIQHLSEETYKKLFQDEEEYWKFVEENIHKYIDALQERIDKADNNLSKYASKLKESYTQQIEQKENLIKKQQALYDIQEAEFNSLNKISDIYRSINKELAASKIATAYLTEDERKQIFNEDDYNFISDKLKSTNQSIKALTVKFNEDIAQAYKDNNLYLVETMTAEYKRQLDMKERELEITQKQVDLQKKRDALNNILNEKNIRQVVEKNGKLEYEWTYDTDKARAAAEELADIEGQISKAEAERQQQAILNTQQGYIDMVTDKKGALSKTIDMIDDAVSRVSTAIDELKNPISSINNLIVSFETIGISSLNTGMNDFLNILSEATGNAYALLPTDEKYNKEYDYMEEINNELAKGLEANWYKIAEANTRRNAKIKGESLDDLPWQGISSKTDSMNNLLILDKDGGEIALVPKQELSLKNFRGWDNPEQSHIFGNGLSSAQIPLNKQGNKTITNTVGDIIIQHPANFNDFVKQVKERISSMGLLLD